MSKISNYVKKHKIFTAFLCLVLLFVLVWSGGRIYKIYYPNQAYYGTDFMYNGEAYNSIDANWDLLQEPKLKLGKAYKSQNSVLPTSTLYGFGDDPGHIILRKDNPFFLSPITYMKKKDYNIFDINCIDKIVIEHWSIPNSEDLVGYIELEKSEELSVWVSAIQDLRNNKYAKSDDYGYRSSKYRAYFYIKGVPNARYWVGDINMEDNTIEIRHTGWDKLYTLPKELAEMIENGKEIPVIEEPAQ